MKKILIIPILSVIILITSASTTNITSNKASFQQAIKTLSNEKSFHEVSSNIFKLIVPTDWKTTLVANENILFGKEQEDDVGEIYIKRLIFLDGEPIITENIIHRMLPNHLDINSEKRLEGFFTNAYLLNVTMIAPPPQGGQFIGNWTYIIFIDYGKSTSKQIIAYGLSLNTKYVSEQEAINIAKTIKIK